MHTTAYKHLAEHLDSLAEGFPATDDGSELRILEKLFTPEEAELASELTDELETAEQIAVRTGRDPAAVRDQLKSLRRRGLISAGRVDEGVGYKSLPFILGFYENQLHSMDTELAHLVEAYFKAGFNKVLAVEPQFHRVVPAHEALHEAVEIRPFESVAAIARSMGSWGVQGCVCREQKALLGQVCKHPNDVCLALSPEPHAFDDEPDFRRLTLDEALGVLRRAAEAGLVHTTSNTIEGATYVCNCCTCCCGLLRGIAEFGIANAVVSSPFVNTVQPEICDGCEACVPACPFEVISMDEGLARIDRERCMGCGVCVLNCAREALVLVRRPPEEIKPIPLTKHDWAQQRLAARGL